MLWAGGATARAATPEPAHVQTPQVVILNSYHQGEIWSADELAGILPTLQHHYPDLIPDIENLDAQRFPEREHQEMVADYLAEKYRGHQVDLVMVLDNPALELLLEHRRRLFPGVPVVFAGINDFRPAMLRGQSDITGISENRDMAGSLELALSLQPGLHRALAIHDYSASGLAMRREMEKVLPRFADKLTVDFAPNVPLARLERLLRRLPRDNAVFLLSYVTDATGRVFSRAQSTELFSQASPAPVYTLQETRLGYGTVGGRLIDGVHHGERAAQIALQVLGGRPAADIPVAASVSAPKFDYLALQRFGIPLDRLPAGSVVINQPVTLWEQYREVVLPASVVGGALLLWIGLLVASQVKLVRANRAIRQGQKRYLTMVRNSLDGFLVVDEEGRILEFNDAYVRMSGFAAEQLLTMRIGDLEAREDSPAVTAHAARMGERGWSRYETRHRRTDGSLMEVEVSAFHLPEQRQVLSFVHEITERKEAEEALRESEARFSAIFNAMTDALVLADPERRIMLMNPAAEKMFGYRLEEVQGQSTRVLYTDEEAFLEAGQRAFRPGGDVRREPFEFVYRRRDGSLVQAETLSAQIEDASGNVWGLMGIHRDISQRKAAEEALAAAQERYRAIVESSPYGILLSDREGRIMFSNPAHRRLYGAAWNGLDGRFIWDLVADPGRKEVTRREYLAAIARQPAPQTHYNLERTPDGRLVHVRVDWDYLRDSAGELIGICSIITDITAQVQADKERGRLEAELRQAQKMEAIGTLAGGIAHDFNNILSAIFGFTELALDGAREGEDNSLELAQVLGAAERARLLVKQLLTFSRKGESHRRPLVLNKLINHALPLLQSSLPKMIRLEVNLADDLPLVNADPNQLEQVLLNLASNAADAMPAGGRLIIETAPATLDQEFARRYLEVLPGDYVLLRVRDTGQGMDQDIQEKIFDPFYTTKEVGKGTGLGLSIVFGIVKDHGGYVFCDSEPGGGAVFQLYLPVCPTGEAAVLETPPSPEALLAGSETILVVDDEAPVRTVASRMLAGLGYRVLTAASGEEALEAYRPETPPIALVLLDLGMPGMGGHACLQELLRQDPRAKVVIASGYAAHGQVQASLTAGAAGFVAKPFMRRDLLTTVRRVLDSEPGG
ncbi:MAG: PAS domain S-box protein [Deltaproteobacteria bacterium]|nr:PAS domain S-box protein [Deltaproteobacteria bacterium]